MDYHQDLFPKEILLSDEFAAAKKREREYRIYAKLEPIVRIVAMALMTGLATAFSFLGYTQFSISSILYYALSVFVIYCLGTWALLRVFYKSHPAVYDLVSILDFFFMTVGVYFTGGEQSLLFFVYITRIADQITTPDKRRVLYFAILAPLFYTAMLYYILAVDGREINFKIEGIKMLSLLGCSAYLMVVGRSVSKIKQRTSSFLRAAKLAYRMAEEKRGELEKLNDRKNEFLGMAAHDLRNPLNAISGVIDLTIADIKAGQFNAAESEKDLENVLKMVRRMSHIISELLDISSIESGKVHMDIRETDLNHIFDECEAVHVRTAAHKNITLTLNKKTNLPRVMADKARLMSVMDNLLSNAIKYTFAGGRIDVLSEIKEGFVVTHVKDTGQGLSEEDLKYVFTSFKKLSSRPTAGEPSTGLGLAIVKKLVELHGGQIQVESRKGVGSTFSFSLRISPADKN